MSLIALSPGLLGWLACVAFVAGIARGFTGFAASATIMALAASFVPPIALIPICLILELVASALLVRGGFADADRPLALLVQAGALVGVPLGLMLTQRLDPDLSRRIALALVAGLAALQLARVPLPVGQGRVGAAVAGFLAGVVNGLASIGGLVHALYIMARDLPARRVRGTMILIILIGGAVTLAWHLLLGVMTLQALARAGALLMPFVAGLWLGRRHFTPENERHYRPVSLALLVGLALAGLARDVL